LTLALKSGILRNIHGVEEVAKSSQWKIFRDFLLASVSLLVMADGAPIVSATNQNERAPQKQLNDSIPAVLVKNPVQTVCFRNDTLSHYASALLTYCNNQIIRNFVKDSKIHRMQLPYFSHEKWHHHNKKFTYWKRYKYSPSQFIQLRMHEEISANVAAILTADFEYQLAKDKQKVIKKYENTYMKFYFDAIKDGTINPESTDSLERDKKYGLLMNGAIRMWEQKFRAHYTPSLISSLTQYLKNYGFHKPHDKNYHRALTHLYSFGGIDLSKYIKDDAEFVDIKLKMCDELAGVKSLNKSKNERQSVVDDVFLNGDKLRKFPDAKRPIVMQHLFVATKLKFELEKLNAYDLRENSSAVTAAYNKVMYELAIDANFKKMILSSADFKMTRVPFDDKEYKTYLKFYPVSNLLDKEDFEIIRHFYQFRNVDLTRLINGFDINDKPLDDTALATFGGRYFAKPSVEELIHKLPRNFSTKTEVVNQDLPTDASLVHITSGKAHKKANIRRMSKDLFVLIPNFEEPLLVPEAMTAEAQEKLKELFMTYDKIPDAFKNCDIEAIEKYIEMHGNPHYFESKISPFKPKPAGKIKNDSLTLARVRKMRQRN